MIIPSIDIMNGQAVQLIGGREKALDGGDPLEVAEGFSIAGPMAVIDLDAALGRGNNRAIIERLVAKYPCRVGGGIRTVEDALAWLDAGAEYVILGTAATEDILKKLPSSRVMAALDAVHGEVVVEGWQKNTGVQIKTRIEQLKQMVAGFLFTFVELEGRLGGTDLEQAKQLVELSKPAFVTIAGGITTAEEVAQLDQMGADSQVGMALYTNQLPLADAIAAPLKSDRLDGLWPTVVCDEMGVALGLVYSNLDSLRASIQKKRGIYYSRLRGIWEKGLTSGNGQILSRIDLDCDRDALRFIVQQLGQGFCHRNTWTCFQQEGGLGALERRLSQRLIEDDAESYTRRLIADPLLLAKKLKEEAIELGSAQSKDDVIWEAADVFYFTMVAMARSNVRIAEVEQELNNRRNRIRRRSILEANKKKNEVPE